MEFTKIYAVFSKFVWRKICVEKKWQIWGLKPLLQFVIIKTASPLMIRHVDIFVFTLTVLMLIGRSEKHLRQCGDVPSFLLFSWSICLFVRRLSKFQASKFLGKPVRQRSGVPVLSAGGIYCRISAGIYHHHTHAAHFPNTFNLTTNGKWSSQISWALINIGWVETCAIVPSFKRSHGMCSSAHQSMI